MHYTQLPIFSNSVSIEEVSGRIHLREPEEELIHCLPLLQDLDCAGSCIQLGGCLAVGGAPLCDVPGPGERQARASTVYVCL